MALTALIIGFAGSMHCLGMCSPLVMVVTRARPSAFLNRILYNAGRVAMYGLLGAVVSSAGMVLSSVHKAQNILSLVLGIALLLLGFGAIEKLQVPGLTSVAQRATLAIKKVFAHQLGQKTRGAMVILGALNGLLPCGLTLVALTWCLTLKGPLDGFNFMLLFGAGTLPVMLGFTGILPLLIKTWNLNIRKVTTVMLILSGVVLIARAFIIHVPHAHSPAATVVDMLCR